MQVSIGSCDGERSSHLTARSRLSLNLSRAAISYVLPQLVDGLQHCVGVTLDLPRLPSLAVLVIEVHVGDAEPGLLLGGP